VTKIIFVKIMNLVTLKSGAKHELLFDEPALDVHEKFFFVDICGVKVAQPQISTSTKNSKFSSTCEVSFCVLFAGFL